MLGTFFPFEQANLHQLNTSLQIIGNCSESSRVVYHDLFPYKIPKKWKNSTITFCYLPIEPIGFANDTNKGIGTEIYRLILKLMGASSKTSMSTLKTAGSKQMKISLKSRNCDFSVSAMADDTFDLTVPYHFAEMYWFVPSPTINENYNFILGTFTTSVWLICLATILCISLFWYFLCHLTEKEQQGYLLEKFVLTFKLLLEQGIEFKILRKSEFILYTILIFSTFMMGNIYKSRLLYVLSGLHYEESITTEESIMEHKLKIGLPPLYKHWFEHHKQFLDYMNKNYQACGFDMKCEDMVAFQRNTAILRGLLVTEYHNKRYIGEDGRLKRIRLPDPALFIYYICFFLPGQPIFPQVNQYTHYLLQNGVVSKIISNYNVRPPEQTTYYVRKVLNTHDLKWSFFIWMIGLIAACVIFAWEKIGAFLKDMK
ncbi:hypothetical protein HHI36_000410 [Cryptolaemus montrouzieri]|uniref:Ionotropic receptor n=1 Tax=Cryptolaemus montrouzieri TaxID=559131 RepID=A0ABD2P5M9_9CUCU